MKKIVIDLDHTLTLGTAGTIPGQDKIDYAKALPNNEVIERLRDYKEMGFEICVFTSRNMRTFEGNVGKINVVTLPIILAWLEEHDVPYDEVVVGKPWCGTDGFYVDDKAIRPSEFTGLEFSEIQALLSDNPSK